MLNYEFEIDVLTPSNKEDSCNSLLYDTDVGILEAETVLETETVYLLRLTVPTCAFSNAPTVTPSLLPTVYSFSELEEMCDYTSSSHHQNYCDIAAITSPPYQMGTINM